MLLLKQLFKANRAHEQEAVHPDLFWVYRLFILQIGVENMERLKNVYRILIETESGNKEILIFSHTHDNAVKKARVYFERKGVIIKDIVNAEKIHDNIIY